eukprot:m.168700 g.168700  ORF g.168700 m.168700 type:complete len:423 (+) comp12991_c0_seq1:217-1485(+)
MDGDGADANAAPAAVSAEGKDPANANSASPSKESQDAEGKEAEVTLVECPICFDMKGDVSMLVHRGQNKDAADPGSEVLARTKSGRDTSEHKACKECQEQMVAKGQSCPWCRDEVVWQDIFGFLDGIKGATVQAADPNSLADLMAKWQEYELTRSQSDVLVFAKNMVEDVALFKHLERAVESKHGFIRDSSGLWCRFHAMILDGELKVDKPNADLLEKAVSGFLDRFDEDGGSAPQYAGAVYAQVAAAYMCAMCSGMSTKSLIPMCKRVGLACCKHWDKRPSEVRQLLPKYFAEAVTDAVWGNVEDDQMMQVFFLAPNEDQGQGALFGGVDNGEDEDGSDDYDDDDENDENEDENDDENDDENEDQDGQDEDGIEDADNHGDGNGNGDAGRDAEAAPRDAEAAPRDAEAGDAAPEGVADGSS